MPQPAVPWKKFCEGAAIQAAFVAIASRIVGSAFRCLETLNPQYQQTNVGNDPKTVCIRELSTISMAWCFALVTNVIITPKAEARNWSKFRIQFLTSVIGTAIAESIGRLIAYRKLYRSTTKQPPAPAGSPPFPPGTAGYAFAPQQRFPQKPPVTPLPSISQTPTTVMGYTNPYTRLGLS